eukprot:Pgem_evm2s962
MSARCRTCPKFLRTSGQLVGLARIFSRTKIQKQNIGTRKQSFFRPGPGGLGPEGRSDLSHLTSLLIYKYYEYGTRFGVFGTFPINMADVAIFIRL